MGLLVSSSDSMASRYKLLQVQSSLETPRLNTNVYLVKHYRIMNVDAYTCLQNTSFEINKSAVCSQITGQIQELNTVTSVNWDLQQCELIMKNITSQERHCRGPFT